MEEMSVTRIGEVFGVAAPARENTRSQIGAKLERVWKRTVASSAQAADVLVALVTPIAVVVLVLGLWRLSSDMGWTESFFISGGLFSHWQVWIALAIALKFGGGALAAKMVPVQAAQPVAKADQRV